ncbi:MAG: hypothetical protein QOG85_2236 [Gaiellaceae bacterium]|nr:hypothetical protein [Gaiellaceae bacterium]
MKMRAFDALAAQLWAIDEAWLELMASISLGEGEGPEAVAAKLGRPLQNAQESTVRDGVAIHPVIGPLFRYANLFTMVSGATSIEVLARDFGAAEANPEVRRHLLEVNSPGGQADGVNELAKMIAGARKPVVAYVGGMAASGGYWIASAADQVVIDETAQLGSIGVVMQIEKSKRPGDDSFEIVSSRSPRKRIDPRTDEGRAEILSRIDAIADVFIVAVADYRGVSIEHVGAEFGGGGIVVGAKAISAGMADTLGSFESTLAQLAGGYEPRRRRKMTNISISEEDLGKRIEAARSEARTAGVEGGR